MPVVAAVALAVLSSCTASTRSSGPAPNSSTNQTAANNCVSADPLAVASTFLAAVNADDQELYSQCVYTDASGDEVTAATLSSWTAMVRDGDFVVTDVLQRPEHMYAFNSRANVEAEATQTDFPIFDVGGRVDVAVTLKSDGNYYVTTIGFEVHG